MGDDLVSGVGIDLEFLRERANGRKSVPGAKLASDHRFLRRIDNLLKFPVFEDLDATRSTPDILQTGQIR